MKKQDFLEILRDYLKNNFSNEEVEDIIRDYEEHFIEGAIEGKTELEIISGLGSPKSIADALLEENGVKIKEKTSKLNSIMKELQNKFKINLNEENHVNSRKRVKLKQVLVTVILAPIAIGVVMSTIGAGAGLVASILGGVASIPFATSFARIMPELSYTTIFGGIAFVGFEILVWQLFFGVVKLELKILRKYRNWMGLTNKYINASEIIEESEKEVQ